MQETQTLFQVVKWPFRVCYSDGGHHVFSNNPSRSEIGQEMSQLQANEVKVNLENMLKFTIFTQIEAFIELMPPSTLHFLNCII